MTKKIKIPIRNTLGLLAIAFMCGVIFQFVQVVVFDTLGIDRILDIFMVPSLVIIPAVVSVLLSYIYHKNKKWIIVTGLLTLTFASATLNVYRIGPGVPPEHYTLPAYVENVSLWDHGSLTSLNTSEGLSGYLLYTIQRLNLQAKCIFNEERVNQLKQNGKVIELNFKSPVNITISQRIEPEESDHILTDKNGYRILENVKGVLFVLDGDLKGHVLIGREIRGGLSYGCWAISKPLSNEIDEGWVNEVENALNEMLDYCEDKLYPETVGQTYFDDSIEANNTVALLIKTCKPLTEEQIQILRSSGVKKLSASELETIYHALIEEDMVDEVKSLDFVESVYPYKMR
jgi:hypothetical protein